MLALDECYERAMRRTYNPQGTVAQLCVQPHAPLLRAGDELLGVRPRGLEVDDCYIAHLEWPPRCHLHKQHLTHPSRTLGEAF